MNIKLNLKFDKSTILVFIPFIIVLIYLMSNIIIDSTSQVIKFRASGVDPYNIMMGKYIDLNLEQDEIVIPELDGTMYINSYTQADEMLSTFIKTYYKLDASDKTRLDNIFEDMKKDAEKLNEINDEFKLYYEKITNLNSDLTYNVKYENAYIKNTLMKQFFKFSKALDNTNILFSEYMNRINFVEKEISDDAKNKNDIQLKIYVYYDIDENGYAKINKVTLNKDKTLKSNLCLTYKINTSSSYCNLFETYNINNGIQYYIDERISENADDVLNEASNSNKEIIAVCKISNNNILVKDILIDNVSLDECAKKYNKEEN